jgi:hypothetical protein
MTRAADEPQLRSPYEERHGYLEQVLWGIDVGSPDALHGAAHDAPLTGLDLPFLDLLADLNDEMIEAGLQADLPALARVRELARRRVLAELDALPEVALAPGDDVDAALDRVRLAGEAMTAEIALGGAPDQLGPIVAARLRTALDDVPGDPGERWRDEAAAIVEALEAGDAERARSSCGALLAELGVAPLPAP